MITLEEYREEFINDIKVDAIENNQYPVENFIEKMKDILINDYSLVSDLENCFFEGTNGNKKMHIDAAYLELSTNVLDLLIADFNPNEIIDINKEFITSKSKLMLYFFESVLKGYFNGAEQSNPATQLSVDIRKNISSINKIHLLIVSTNKMSKYLKTTELPDFNIGERTFKVDLDVIGIENIYNTTKRFPHK